MALTDVDEIEFESHLLGAMPIVNHFLHRLELDAALEHAVPDDDPRLRLAPAKVLGVVVRNLVVHHGPVYAMGEWAGTYSSDLLGLNESEVAGLNDDRVGRMLTRLFDADRASLLTGVVLGMVRTFDIDCSQLHNDSTSITLSGVDYPEATTRGNQPVPQPAFGHNKDHRPDLLQLLYILTISADGAVPIAYRVESGNTNDDVTHVPTWDQLRELVGREDFLYVADCKLASAKAMAHIDANHGRFVTVLPANRNEVTWFTNWIQDHVPTWAEARRRPARRHGDPDEVWQTFESPLPSDAGYRVIWVHSNSKQARDAATREAHIEAALCALDALSLKLAGPRCRMKSVVAVETAVADALLKSGATRYFATHVDEVSSDDFRQARKGRPGPDTRYAKTTKVRFALSFAVRTDAVSADAKSDGMFPLITNDRVMTPGDVLDAYKYQPNLERRHAQLKGHQQVAPVYLKDPVRIEGLLCCHFFALIVQALIEREIHTAMKAANTTAIALYPELRDCVSPSAERILEIFAGISRHVLRDGDGQVLKIFEPKLDRLQLQVLELLGIPQSAYILAKSTLK
jgi:transposase